MVNFEHISNIVLVFLYRIILIILSSYSKKTFAGLLSYKLLMHRPWQMADAVYRTYANIFCVRQNFVKLSVY